MVQKGVQRHPASISRATLPSRARDLLPSQSRDTLPPAFSPLAWFPSGGKHKGDHIP
jgi:hypothetical protein